MFLLHTVRLPSYPLLLCPSVRLLLPVSPYLVPLKANHTYLHFLYRFPSPNPPSFDSSSHCPPALPSSVFSMFLLISSSYPPFLISPTALHLPIQIPLFLSHTILLSFLPRLLSLSPSSPYFSPSHPNPLPSLPYFLLPFCSFYSFSLFLPHPPSPVPLCISSTPSCFSSLCPPHGPPTLPFLISSIPLCNSQS